jgi:hypothetical protein
MDSERLPLRPRTLQAKRVVDEVKTSLDYGNLTWTNLQTVRDLFQNHLDAETEKYFTTTLRVAFGEKTLERMYAKAKQNPEYASQVYWFGFKLMMHARHRGEYSPETLKESEASIQFSGAMVAKTQFFGRGKFDLPAFLSRMEIVREEKPQVRYKLFDTVAGTSIGWVNGEEMQSPRYTQSHGEGLRYMIDEVKIRDSGSGYDHALGSVFLSTKGQKHHVRGQFGEGEKMSMLHLLRKGIHITKRSSYTKSDGTQKVWQTRSRENRGRLQNKGVEITPVQKVDTGTETRISFPKDMNDDSRSIRDTLDPRNSVLQENIVEYGERQFIYPSHFSNVGINISAPGELQYVHGLRVEIGAGSIAPLFSYNVLDSSVIRGRDRNQIADTFSDAIHSFWKSCDSPQLLETLAARLTDASLDEKVPEAIVLHKFISGIGVDTKGRLLHDKVRSDGSISERVQYLFDSALVRVLQMKRGSRTILFTESDEKGNDFASLSQFAQEQGCTLVRVGIDLKALDTTRFDRRNSGYKLGRKEDATKRRQKGRGIRSCCDANI